MYSGVLQVLNIEGNRCSCETVTRGEECEVEMHRARDGRLAPAFGTEAHRQMKASVFVWSPRCVSMGPAFSPKPMLARSFCAGLYTYQSPAGCRLGREFSSTELHT